jgi:hypothetical protein
VNVLWHLPDVTDVGNLDLMEKLIFVQIVAIELQMLQSHLSEIRISTKLLKTSGV